MSKDTTSDEELLPFVDEPEPGQYRLAFERLPAPQVLFYADWLFVKKIVHGIRIAAVQLHPIADTVSAIFEIVMGEMDYRNLVDSLNQIRGSLEAPAEGVLSPPELKGTPGYVECYPASNAYVAVNANGITMDFYYIPPTNYAHAVAKNLDKIEVIPVVRIATLPGRLSHWFAVGDSDEKAPDE